jgi:hypothetical protein
MKKL